MASLTATSSCWLNRFGLSLVPTRPVTSLGRSTFVGRNWGSIIMAGAIELPPESVFCEPINVRIEPSAPARWRPYSGLCGLLLVSFSDRAGITAPLVRAAMTAASVLKLAYMPRRNALSLWNPSPRLVSVWLRLLVPVALATVSATPGTWSPGKPSLLYPAVERKSIWPPCLPTSTFEPARFAPPARSKQMNGIFVPVRSTPQPSTPASAARSSASCARAVRGFANRLNSPVESTVAPPVMKPCAISSRRVIGRRWLSCRCGASGLRSLRLTLMSMIVTSDSKRESLDQHRGAADHGRAHRFGDRARSLLVIRLPRRQRVQQAGADDSGERQVVGVTMDHVAELRASRVLVRLMP